jgi:ribosome-associated protein
MHALQDLGEALALLDDVKLAQLDLSDSLRDALVAVRGITKWEARRRQMQYIGRLMRDIDPEPIRAQLARWDGSSHAETAHLHELERTRDRLLEDPATLDTLCAEHHGLDRAHWRMLIQRAKDERTKNQPPKAFRQLFRDLRALYADPTADESHD